MDFVTMPEWISILPPVHLAQISDYSHIFIHLAQTFEDNLGGNVSNAFQNFIESGQVWALGIGFILGYIVRSITAY